jgi:hypothetical protein
VLWGGDLVGLAVHAPTANHLAVAVEAPVLLADACTTVSVAGEAVAVLHHLASWHVPELNLLLIGDCGGPDGRIAVAEHVRELGLPRCWLLGAVADDVRAACWHRADVALALDLAGPAASIASTADAFGVPVVGRSPGCVAVVPDQAGPVWAAEAVAVLLAPAEVSS